MFLVRCTMPWNDFKPGLVYRSRFNHQAGTGVQTIRIRAGYIESSDSRGDQHGDNPIGDDGSYYDLPVSEFTNYFEWYRAVTLQPNKPETLQIEIVPPELLNSRLEADVAPGLAVAARLADSSEEYVSLHSGGMDLTGYAPGVPVRFDLKIESTRPLSNPQTFPSPRWVITSGRAEE
jgi:hypothetical protein